MLLKSVFALVLSTVVICESAFVDTLTKCSKDDGDCLGKLVQNVLSKMPEEDFKKIGMPSIDPAKLNISISIENLLEITLNGMAKGVRKTVVNKFTPNFEGRYALLDLLCNIVIKGNYTLLSFSPVIRSLFQKDIHGNGYGKLKLENLNLKLKMPYTVKKIGDDIFLIGKKDEVTYSYDIGKLMIAADNLYVGDVESSATIIPFINQEWKTLVKSHGKFIFDKAIEVVKDFTYTFCSQVATKKYITEDLSPYVTETE